MFDQFDGPPTRLNGRLWQEGDGIDDLNIDSYLEQHEDERMLEVERENFEEWCEEEELSLLETESTKPRSQER